MEQVVPEELEDVTLARLRPIPRPSAAAAALLGPLIQGAELEEQPQDPPVVVLAFGVVRVVFSRECADERKGQPRRSASRPFSLALSRALSLSQRRRASDTRRILKHRTTRVAIDRPTNTQALEDGPSHQQCTHARTVALCKTAGGVSPLFPFPLAPTPSLSHVASTAFPLLLPVLLTSPNGSAALSSPSECSPARPWCGEPSPCRPADVERAP